MDLNRKNYYSAEANWQYMSVSQFKAFQECEEAALAQLKGEWVPNKENTALLVGNYVHSYFESKEAHEQFIEENRTAIFKKDGKERSEFSNALDMIKTLEHDQFFQFLYQGEREVILTGRAFGTEWKARIDCFNRSKNYFVDLKTTRNLANRVWSSKYGTYVSFVEGYGYVLQMGVYKKLLEQQVGTEITPYIFAVTKETIPDLAAIEIYPGRFEFELTTLEQELPHILKVKNGEEAPRPCGKCDYCKKHKQLTGFIEVGDLLDL